MKSFVRRLAGLSAAAAVLCAAACTAQSGTVNTTPVSPAAGGSGTAASKAVLGSAISLAGQSSGDKIQVTVVKIVDPDSSTDGFSSPPAGQRYVSVQFQIVNTGTGAYQDDPLGDVTAKDAAGQSFQPDLTVGSTAAGAQLDSSTNLAPGDKSLGFATFDVPTGDKIAQVLYSLNGGMFGNSGEWSVG